MPLCNEPVGKVTVFVTRARPDGSTQLLLMRHVGIQLPAGTIEPGETPLAAAQREATEETGLGGLQLVAELGKADDDLGPDGGVMVATSTLHTRPSANSPTWGSVRYGFRVHLLAEVGDWLQVEYREANHEDAENPWYVLRGWVPAQMVASQQTRHYFHFTVTAPTPDRWTVHDEGHDYVLAWYPLHELPAIVEPQVAWLRHFPPTL